MMNTSQPQLNSLPESELELLSAYIDDQLTAPERAELERRLGAEPRLRAELAELRATTALLRDLDPLPPPRSFSLNPATAPRRRGLLSFAWAMQLGGGLAGFALVFLASLQLLVGVGGGAAASAPAPAAMMAEPTQAPMAAAPMAAEMAPAATEAPIAAAQMAPEATQDASAARNTAESAAASDTGAAAEPYGAGDASAATAAPTPAIAASGLSSPDTGSLEQSAPPPTAKEAPQPAGLPASIILGLGILLMAAALGSFLYSRARR